MRIAFVNPNTLRLKALFNYLSKEHNVFKIKKTDDVSHYDAVVCWSMKKELVVKNCKASNTPLLVAEMGYLGNRNKNTSLGWNGLNGDADFCTDNVSDDRAKQWKLKPWKTKGSRILLLGQVIGDYSFLRMYKNINVFYAVLFKKLQNTYKMPVYFRPHPKWAPTKIPAWVKFSEGKSLEEDLEKAWLAVAWNSNSLTDAVVNGTPVLAIDKMAMTWDVAIHKVGETPIRPDRQDWLNKVSYSQWTDDEIANGTAWNHLKQYLELNNV